MTEQDLTIDLDHMSARELVTILDQIYPEQCISPQDTLESAHRYAGRRELIRELVFMRDYEDAEDQD